MKKILPKKKWGQNFLIDKNIAKKIVDIADIKSTDDVLEIGPGTGSLTEIICQKAKETTCVEIDPNLSEFIVKKELNKVYVENCDILKYEPNNINNAIIIGNLPYNITTPIIFKFLKKNNWKKMVFMVQKEVGQRIVSEHNSKIYGRLSVMCQTYSKINFEFTISKNVFYPKPKVESCVISFLPRKIKFTKDYETFIRKCFSNRRKILKNNLKDYSTDLPEKILVKRPAELTVDEYIDLMKNNIIK